NREAFYFLTTHITLWVAGVRTRPERSLLAPKTSLISTTIAVLSPKTGRMGALPALADDGRPVGAQLEQAGVHLAAVHQVGAGLAQRHVDRPGAVIQEEQDRAVAERASDGLHAGRRIESRLDSRVYPHRPQQARHRGLIQPRADVVRGTRSELVARHR